MPIRSPDMERSATPRASPSPTGRRAPSSAPGGRLAAAAITASATLLATVVAVAVLSGPRGPAVVAALVAGATAWATGRRPVPVAAAAEAVVPAVAGAGHEAELRELRHDLRGILSPAMMMADRVLMSSQDPLARRCADTVIASIERAERRLSATPSVATDASAPRAGS